MNTNSILITKYAKKIEQKNDINLGTQTFTEIKTENTDSDKDYSISLGTRTHTNTMMETTDSDQDRILLGTQTMTKNLTEGTDSDR